MSRESARRVSQIKVALQSGNAVTQLGDFIAIGLTRCLRCRAKMVNFLGTH